ncbi:MAG: DNA mismatch repair endonuclease MutL [Chitinivibrionales bacterium]|nr:DNA mismatch repair endonuclease MutL [Chitinivibrionales bacterium]
MSEAKRSTIRLLTQSVIDKIAAGEIIERPASVVKELVENAIDADATQIDISIEEAGFALIKVSDNGSGIHPDDLSRSILRHATSKISTVDDLYSLFTLGFRGEALASIAAISVLEIQSSIDSSGMGAGILVDNSGVGPVTPVAHGRGSTISSRNLFYSVPARKKFMKTPRAEQLAVVAMIDSIACSYPAIHFTCYCDAKRYLDYPAVDTLQQRVGQIAGSEYAKSLLHGVGENFDMSAQIFITHPHRSKSRSQYQNLYVNLRRVDNDSVLYAVREAFSRFIASSVKPSWFCFLDIKPSAIDVNVHPTKQKVKFEDERGLFGFVYKIVHTTIAKAMAEQSAVEQQGDAALPRPFSSISGATAVTRDVDMEQGFHSAKSGSQESLDGEQIVLPLISVFDTRAMKKNAPVEESSAESGAELATISWNLIPCYQIHRRYVIAPIKNGILIIDQHAAHERILFEEALEHMVSDRLESQRLLFPILFEMSPVEKDVVFSSRDFFNSVGFDIQDFGGKTIAVSSMPATGYMKSSDVEEAIRDMVHNLINEKDDDLLSHPQRRFAASYACGAAIKFGQQLSQEEMNMLLNNLFATKSPYTCPHGRPTLIRISLDELARRFLR